MDRRCLTLALAALLLAGCGGNDAPTVQAGRSPSSAASSASAASAPSGPTSAPATASPDSAGSKGGVVLGGEELGVTRIGTPMDQAVAEVTTVLGEPDEDPATTVSCIESDREVRWGDFVLAGRDGRLAGWRSTSSTLQTPAGVTVGTDLPTLQRVYGGSLQRFPANPDNPPTFAVDGVDVRGGLSSAGDDAVVTDLHSSFCSGP